MSALPAPIVPAGVDLRDFAANETPECCWAAVLLWAASWHQVPAGSIPNDDRWIAKQAGYAQRGKIAAEWVDVRGGALHGWVLCSDGRLYHPVVAEKALDAWREKLTHRWKKECDRVRKENKARETKGLAPLDLPPSPAETVTEGTWSDGNERGTDASELSVPSKIGPGSRAEAPQKPVPMDSTPFPAESFDFPPETGIPSDGIPLENALKGQGQGQGVDLPCPKPAAPVRTKRAYPAEFEQFWQGYPTDPIMSKAKAGEAWGKLGPEDRLAALAAVPGVAEPCRRDPTDPPVHAVRFLTERRYDGFAPKPSALELKFGLVDQLRVDFGRGQLVPDDTVLTVMRRGEWIDDWGARRGQPGCRLPERILVALAEDAA